MHIYIYIYDSKTVNHAIPKAFNKFVKSLFHLAI